MSATTGSTYMDHAQAAEQSRLKHYSNIVNTEEQLKSQQSEIMHMSIYQILVKMSITINDLILETYQQGISSFPANLMVGDRLLYFSIIVLLTSIALLVAVR